MLRSGRWRHVERHEHDALIHRTAFNQAPQHKYAWQVTLTSCVVVRANIALERSFRYNLTSLR
jgi:hypothetical protein